MGCGFGWTWAIAWYLNLSPFPYGRWWSAQDSQMWVHGYTMFGPQPVPRSSSLLEVRPLDINLYDHCIFYLKASLWCISIVFDRSKRPHCQVDELWWTMMNWWLGLGELSPNCQCQSFRSVNFEKIHLVNDGNHSSLKLLSSSVYNHYRNHTEYSNHHCNEPYSFPPTL